MIKFILGCGAVFGILFVILLGAEYLSMTPEARANQSEYRVAEGAAKRSARNVAAAKAAVVERARVEQEAIDEATRRRHAPAEKIAAKLKQDSIRYCQEYINTGLRSIGGASFTFGGTVYMPKGYGALVVGTAKAGGRDIDFKCSFDDRTGSRMLMSGSVKDHDGIWR